MHSLKKNYCGVRILFCFASSSSCLSTAHHWLPVGRIVTAQHGRAPMMSGRAMGAAFTTASESWCVTTVRPAVRTFAAALVYVVVRTSTARMYHDALVLLHYHSYDHY